MIASRNSRVEHQSLDTFGTLITNRSTFRSIYCMIYWLRSQPEPKKKKKHRRLNHTHADRYRTEWASDPVTKPHTSSVWRLQDARPTRRCIIINWLRARALALAHPETERNRGSIDASRVHNTTHMCIRYKPIVALTDALHCSIRLALIRFRWNSNARARAHERLKHQDDTHKKRNDYRV